MKLDYSKDALIDVNALDIEWRDQPDLEAKYIKQVADKRKELTSCIENEKILHEELKTTRSKLILDAHTNSDKHFQKSKATGPEVEAFYRTHEDYKEAKEDWIEAETEVNEAQDAFDTANDMKDLIHFTRSKALEKLVELHGQGYFAGPSVPRNLNKEILKKEEKEKRQKKTSKKIGKGLKRTKNPKDNND